MYKWPAIGFLVLCLCACSAGSGEGLDNNGRPIGENPPDDNPAPLASFKQIQDDIFTPFCIICHAGAAAPVGLRLDNANSYNNLVSVASAQAPGLLRVSPGNPQQSYLLQKVTGSASVGSRMPLGGAALSDELISSLRTWISNGALPDVPDSSAPPVPQIAATVPAANATLSMTPTAIIVVLTTPMDFSLLNDSTVVLRQSGDDQVFDSADDLVIMPSALVSTNPQTFEVRLNNIVLDDGDYRLTLLGSSSLSLTSLLGVVIDGDGNGEPGGDFVLPFSVVSSPPEAQPTWRWLQDNVFTPICTQCHSDGGIAAFLNLDENNSFAMLVNQTSNQNPMLSLVTPNDADNSYLVQKIEGTAAIGAQMPLGLTPLDDATISALRVWIDNGALLGADDPMPDVNNPVVALALPTTSLSGTLLVIVSASDDRGVIEVSLLVDDNVVSSVTDMPYELSLDTTLISDGIHTLRAQARDAAGNIGSSAEFDVTISNAPPPDTQLPTVSIEPITSPASGALTVNVTATDNDQVQNVQLLLDNQLFASLDLPPYSITIDTTTLSNGSHVLQAVAQDASGNTSQSSNQVFVVENELPDEQSPVVSISPVNNPVSGTVVINVSANDNVAVTAVRLFFDDVLQSTQLVAPFSFSIDTTVLTEGDHTAFAEATDEEGNVGQSALIMLTIDNLPEPDTEAPIVVLDSISNPVSGTLMISADASDNNAISQVNLYLDNVLIQTLATTPYLFTLDTTTLADGSYQLRAEAVDTSGNLGQSSALELIVDNAPPPDIEAPSVVLASFANPVSGTQMITVEATDNVVVSQVNLYIDDVLTQSLTASPYVFTLDTTTLVDGTYQVRADATDASGNIGLSSTNEMIVDNAPPPDIEAPSVVLEAFNNPVSGSQTITVEATDNVGISQVDLYIDNILTQSLTAAPYVFTLDTTTLNDGSYQVRADGVDASGNVGQSSTNEMIVDNTPPPDIEEPSVSIDDITNPVMGTVDVIMTATDNAGVTQVRLYLDEQLQTTLTAAPFTFALNTTLLVDDSYDLRAEAEDAAGNVATSQVVTIEVDNLPPPDVTPPSVNITPPSADIVLSTNISVTASDTVALASVTLFLDNTTVGVQTTSPFVFALDVSALPDGVHLLNAIAQDLSGNIGTATPLAINVVNGTPQSTLEWIQENIFSVSCAAGCHSAGGIASFLPLTENSSFANLVNIESTRGGPQFRVAPNDADNSSLVQRLEGTLVPSMPLGGSILSTELISSVRDWIDSGALETPADVIGPSVSVTLPLAPASGTVTISAQAVDDNNVATLRFFVDGNEIGSDTIAPYETTFDTSTVANGIHQISATAEDGAGNVGTSTTLNLTIAN